MSDPQEGSSTRRKSIWDILDPIPSQGDLPAMEHTRRKAVWDMDDPAHFQVTIPESEGTGSVQQGKKKKRKKPKTGHDKDLTYPPAKYANFAYEVCLQWYAAKSTQFLEASYLRDPLAGSEKLTNDLEARILTKCKESEEFGDVDLTYNSKLFTWLEDTLKACIFNTKKLVADLRPHTPGHARDEEAQEFYAKMEWWATAVVKLSKSKSRGMNWRNEAMRAVFAKNSALSVTWITPLTKVKALSGFDREGEYEKVRKVHIEGLDSIPPYIAFAGKMPKAKNVHDARVQRSVEALVCPLNHPAIIKIFAIHARTMESYTLWWNGGHLGDLHKVDRKVSQMVDWHEVKRVHEIPAEKQKELALFRKHKAKLAWALVYVTSLMHTSGVLHNDLSPWNILLHYPDYLTEIINIGICDWGIASRIDEKAASIYGKPTQKEREEEERGRWWVAPELFYTFGPKNSDTSISIMQSTQKYTEQSDSYSIGKLTEWMKIEDMVHYDKDLFKNADGSKYLAYKLAQLRDPDPKKRSTCIQVTDLLMSPPWNMKPPEQVFRNSPL